MAKGAKSKRHAASELYGIAEIRVAGFKSIGPEQIIEVRPLTILAGANSSGKSAMVQPLLLLKQTLEAAYDAGALLLNGPNVKFTSADQLLSRFGERHASAAFHVGVHLTNGEGFVTHFRKEHKLGFEIEQMKIARAGKISTLWPRMTEAEIVNTGIAELTKGAPEGFTHGRCEIKRERCFLAPFWDVDAPDRGFSFSASVVPAAVSIPEVIHLPGLRGNPERTYPVAAVGRTYPGTFDKYTASTISQWQTTKNPCLDDVNKDLKQLELTGGVGAVQVNDVQIELYVGRLPNVSPARPADRVNVADVGIGVSQTLPVLVALHAAAPGQLVYVEQPETHLHPRAQFELAKVLAAAANRGVRLVVETHSSILLLGVQALVAQDRLAPDRMKLHWFQRQNDGRTTVRSGDLDEAGRFGDWPEDFDDVILNAQKEYLDAAERRLVK